MLLHPWAGFLVVLSFGLLCYATRQSPLPSTPPQRLRFQLRHLHTVTNSTRVIFANPAPIDSMDTPYDPFESYSLRAAPVTTYRPSFSALQKPHHHDWEEDIISGPDVESREVLLELAKMMNNAYLLPDEAGWYDLGDKWSPGYQFGWEPDEDGFRGHVFATEDNSTIVLSIKGTSAGFFGGGPTVAKDKLNDNLLFSCCCARVDWTWTPVCGCYREKGQCDLNCLEEALVEDSLFYPIGMNLYNNLTYMYPDSTIWVIGHSLGGALASLVGCTFGLPVVALEAPGERMAAARLHLPLPPSTNHIVHVYHTADPIAMGTCNGLFSTCAIGGYAMESKCHLGKSIVYDTVQQLSWSVDVRTHGIVAIIERLLTKPWPPSEEIGREVPEAVFEENCEECLSWQFIDGLR